MSHEKTSRFTGSTELNKFKTAGENIKLVVQCTVPHKGKPEATIFLVFKMQYYEWHLNFKTNKLDKQN